MKKYLTFLICVLFANLLSAQKNYLDVPFIETSAKVDTLVTPDRIYISIKINEADTKNKKTVEEQERILELALKSLGINVQEDLVLQDFGSNFKTYFLKGQAILKSKQYSLLIRDAVKAGKVLTALEEAGLSNVDIERTEYSKKDEIKLLLKIKAIKKTQNSASMIANSVNQSIGKAIFISDFSNSNTSNMSNMLQVTIPMKVNT